MLNSLKGLFTQNIHNSFSTNVLPVYTTNIFLMGSDSVDKQTNQEIFNIAFKFIDESGRL